MADEFRLILLNVAALVNGLSVYAVKTAVRRSRFGPAAINFGRFLVGAVLLIPWTPGLGRGKMPLAVPGGLLNAREPRVRDYWIGGLEIAIYTFCTSALQAQGLRTTTVTRASYVIYIAASLVPFLSVLIHGRPLPKTAWLFLASSIVGSLLLCNDGLPPLQGDMWTVAASLAQALYFHRLHDISATLDLRGVLAASAHVVVAMCALWVSCLGGGSWRHTLHVLPLHWGEVLFLGTLVTALGGLLAAERQQSVALYSTAVGSLEPMYSAVCAHVLLKEPIGDMGVLGCCIVTGSAMLMGRWAVVAEVGGEGAEAEALPVEGAKEMDRRRRNAQYVVVGLVLAGVGFSSMLMGERAVMESQAHMPLRARGHWGSMWSVRAGGGNGNRWTSDMLTALP